MAMGILFSIFYQPVANLLFILMNAVGTGSIVVGILLLVVVVKIVLLPTSIKNSRIQKKLGEMSGELRDIKDRVEDKKEQMERTLAAYRKAGVNPLSPILFLLIQIPFFISIFFITKDLGSGEFAYGEVLYDFVSQPAFVDFTLGFGSFALDVSESGAVIIAILIGVSQFVLMHQTQHKGGGAAPQKNARILMYALPPFVALLSLGIVATVGVYWLFNNLVSILQELGIKYCVPRGEQDTTTADTGADVSQ